jgi:uncharacterized iron-regulated membrane protein
MPSFVSVAPRGIWRRVHRWIAIATMALLVPMSLSGSLLLGHDALDATIHPERYATTRGETVLPAATYLANGAAALTGDAQPIALRFPAEHGRPVTVTARVGAPARIFTVYLDPPNARVLDIVDFRASLIGILHRFHENLTIPEYSGRQIVGWAGVGMLVLSLTGLWLWWPRGGTLLAGLRWRRSPTTTANLHHLLGFWISLPLAVVSASGIYLSFPQTARTAMSAVTAMRPQPPRGFGAVVRETALTPDRALEIARAAAPDMAVAAIFLPTRAGGANGASDAARLPSQSPSWRIDLRQPGSGEIATVMVDDRSGSARRLPDPLAGDRAAQWIRWIHEGSHAGPVWQLVVLLCGIFPSALVVTGLVVWLRGWARRRAGAQARYAPQFGAAE